MEEHPRKVDVLWLREKALEFVEGLDRDKKIMGYRYVIKCKEGTNEPQRMGFLQFIQKEIDRLSVKSVPAPHDG